MALKSNGEDAVYPFATAGSEGWIRRQDYDKFGYPMVYIEWDKDDWRYNGEPDKWAFEAHFEPAEEEMSEPTKNQKLGAALRAVADALEDDAPAPAETPPAEATAPDLTEETPPVEVSVGDSDEKWPTQEEYQQAIEEAKAMAESGESFLLIAVQREQHPETGEPILRPVVRSNYTTPESALLLEMQLPKLVMMAHEELAIHRLREIIESRTEA